MRALSEWESKRLLGDIPRPAEMLARSSREAEAFARKVRTRVVAKASGVPHKTERGLVRRDLGYDRIGAVWGELAAAGDGTVLVAEQIEAEVELMVGAYRDRSFGPVVTVGIGGIAAEVFGDLVPILAPPEPGELRAAVQDLKGYSLLKGTRGRPGVDLEALEQIVSAVAALLERDERVVEVDCNPVMVHDGRPLVTDALVVMDSDEVAA